MVQFDEERDFMGIFPSDCSEIAERGSDGIASPFDCQLHNIFRVEIYRVGGERSSRGVFNILVYRENGEVSGVGETTVSEDPLEIIERRDIPVSQSPYGIYNIRGW